MKSKILVLAFAAFTSSCVSTYKPNDVWWGHGYSDLQLSKDSYKISYSSGGMLKKHETDDLALLRASELTKAAGYSGFYIVEANADNAISYSTAPMSSKISGDTVITSGGEVTQKNDYSKTIIIKMTNDKNMSNNALIYDPDMICQSVGKQNNIIC